jgi:hypothetical protein
LLSSTGLLVFGGGAHAGTQASRRNDDQDLHAGEQYTFCSISVQTRMQPELPIPQPKYAGFRPVLACSEDR